MSRHSCWDKDIIPWREWNCKLRENINMTKDTWGKICLVRMLAVYRGHEYARPHLSGFIPTTTSCILTNILYTVHCHHHFAKVKTEMHINEIVWTRSCSRLSKTETKVGLDENFQGRFLSAVPDSCLASLELCPVLWSWTSEFCFRGTLAHCSLAKSTLWKSIARDWWQ